jgi:glucose/arabinose dehydrogenase
MSHRFVRRLSLALLMFVGGLPLVATAEENNTLSVSEQRAGWKLLFDGKSAEQFRNYKKDGLNAGWTIADGALVRAEKGAGDIVTKEMYGSFELSLEYQISKAGNSGIMFHVTEDEPAPWMTGPEIQVQDNVEGHDPQKAGWLYQLYQPNPDPWTKKVADATRPVGEWNHVQVRITPAGCEINMNGYRYASFKVGSDDWNKRVAASKFAKMPKFGKMGKGHICLQDHGDRVAYRNIKVRELPESGAGPDPIDGTLKLRVQTAFPKLEWAGWEPENEQGQAEAFRPILIDNARDGSGRLFVADQRGRIWTFQPGAESTESKLFLDVRDRVQYIDRENEEGLLGLAFHPKFKENGQFYLYYTTKKEPHTSVISQFTLAAGDKTIADPASEKEILRVPQPFWNHNGGTICFGPDGKLYVALGDGGSGNDPLGNGQKVDTILGKILRIDVDHQDQGLAYAIPKDNPFVGKDGVRGEIYATGFRNPWRIAFDRTTGLLYAADVGQNLWEEINLVTAGGNYGWSLREGAHGFGPKGSGPRADLVEPIWEYDHQVGVSITGGLVYRGKAIPELVGKYVYADYVTGKLWALHYDAAAKKVLTNEGIPTQTLPVITFGEDEAGEIYFGVVSADGKGIFQIVKE